MGWSKFEFIGAKVGEPVYVFGDVVNVTSDGTNVWLVVRQPCEPPFPEELFVPEPAPSDPMPPALAIGPDGLLVSV